MRKKAFLALMLTLTIISSSGCQTEIKPADPKDGKYATQTSMTSLEYALYMNKQITVFTNQLSTRMAVAANHKDVQSSNESYMTQQSRQICIEQRKLLGLSQKKVCELLEIKYGIQKEPEKLSRYESGKVQMPSFVNELCKLYGITFPKERYKNPHAWVLADVKPVEDVWYYNHPNGAVIWVKDVSPIDEMQDERIRYGY